MTKLLRVLGGALIAICASTYAIAGAGTGLFIDPEGNGDSAPDFELIEFDTGKKVKLSDYFGKKVVMLEFWATWCNICKAEMPELVKEYNQYKDKGYQLLGITLSQGDKGDLKKIAELKKRYKITYPLLLDKKFEVATGLYKLSGPIPLKLIVDCAGKLRYEHVGDYPDGVREIPFVLDMLLEEPSCKF